MFLQQVKTIILKCVQKNVNTLLKKGPKYIIKDIEISSDQFHKKDSDEENSDEENSDNENYIKE